MCWMPGVRCRLQGGEQRPPRIARGAKVEEGNLLAQDDCRDKGEIPPCPDGGHPYALHAMRSCSLRDGLPGKGHLQTRRWDRRPVLPEVHRLQILHGGLSLRGEELSLQGAGDKGLYPSGRASGPPVLGALAFS